MPKSMLTDAYASMIVHLVALRKEKGVSHVELARRLGRTQQFISAIEQCDRRIDVVEFYAITKALGADPETAFSTVVRKLPERVAI